MLRFHYGDTPWQFGELRLPSGEGPHPVVVVVHGGGWQSRTNLGYMRPVAEALTRRGLATWTVEYRRVGNPGGGWPGTFEDVARSTDYLRLLAAAQPLDLQRVVSVGHSSGGHLALWLAGRRRLTDPRLALGESGVAVRGAVSLAGISDLTAHWNLQREAGRLNLISPLLGGDPDQVPDRVALASPAELLPLGVPQVLVHGDADVAVPFGQSKAYADRARALGDPVRLVELPGLGHMDVVDVTGPAWNRVEQEIRDLLG